MTMMKRMNMMKKRHTVITMMTTMKRMIMG